MVELLGVSVKEVGVSFLELNVDDFIEVVHVCFGEDLHWGNHGEFVKVSCSNDIGVGDGSVDRGDEFLQRGRSVS